MEGYLGLSGALAKGKLPAPTRERIALAVAEINGCDYCLAAHSYLGKNVAKLDDAEVLANRRAPRRPLGGRRGSLRRQRCCERGHVGEHAVRELWLAGSDAAQIIETSSTSP